MTDFKGGPPAKTLAAVSTTAEATVWTPLSGKKFRLTGLIVASSATVNLTLKDNTAGTTLMVLPMLAGSPIQLDLGSGILSAAANNVLTATSSAAATLSGTLFGKEE